MSKRNFKLLMLELDKDCSGTVSLKEFRRGMKQNVPSPVARPNSSTSRPGARTNSSAQSIVGETRDPSLRQSIKSQADGPGATLPSRQPRRLPEQPPINHRGNNDRKHPSPMGPSFSSHGYSPPSFSSQPSAPSVREGLGSQNRQDTKVLSLGEILARGI